MVISRKESSETGNVCIAIFAHDGLISHHCGVGSVVKMHVEILPYFFKKMFSPKKISFFAITPLLNKKCDSYSERIMSKTKEICQKTGGELLYVSNGTDGSIRWGNRDNWKVSSAGGASLGLALSQKYNFCIFFFHDDPFAYSSVLIHRHSEAVKNVLSIWIPHSTALLNDYPHPNPERLDWEVDVISMMKKYPNISFGYTGEFMKFHLASAFEIPQKRFIPARVGVRALEERIKAIHEYNKNVLEALNLKEKYILSYGRCYPSKGFKYLVNAYLSILGRLKHNLILLIPPDTEDLSYYNQIKNLAQKAANRVFILNDFDSDLPKTLINNPNCDLVISLSQCEPCGLVPMEVRKFQHSMGPLLVVSEDCGLGEQIEHSVDGFKVRTDSKDAVANCILHAVGLNEREKIKMLNASKKKLNKKYIIERNIEEMISSVYKNWKHYEKSMQ